LNVTAKIANLMGKSGFPIVGSDVKPINPFPEQWRWTANIYDNYPILNQFPSNVKWEENGGEKVLVDLLLKSPLKTTILELGPVCSLYLFMFQNISFS
jgi:purine nucleosidase